RAARTRSAPACSAAPSPAPCWASSSCRCSSSSCAGSSAATAAGPRRQSRRPMRRSTPAMKRLSLAILAAALSACASMAPEYQRPAAPVAQDWPEGPAAAAAAAAPGDADDAATATADMPWREFVADDRLERLIDIALEQNRDLRIPALHI